MQDYFNWLISRAKSKITFAGNLITYSLFSFVILNRKIVKIPRSYKIDLGDFLSERWLNSIIKKILEIRRGAFIDIGTNLGQTLIKVKTLDAEVEYFGFEPNSLCNYYTNELIKVNKYNNVQFIPVGVSNQTNILPLFLREETDGSASLIAGFSENKFYQKASHVPVFSGDHLIDYFNIKSISILKIDVEGGELEVIDGLKSSISRMRPFILCEILPVYNENSDTGRVRKLRQNALISFLKKESYIINRIMRNGEVVRLDDIGTHDKLELRDYLFIPFEENKKANDYLRIKLN